MPNYRQVPIGVDLPDSVTVGIERHGDGSLLAAVWWPSKGDVDADEADYATVPEALDAAEAARQLHGFREVVVTLQSPDLWDPRWGMLTGEEPIGRVDNTDVSDDEAFTLAKGIEENRDA
jgi:hypothetical protein